MVGVRLTVCHVVSCTSCVPLRLRELNFDVKVYENYKQEEVLDIISTGEQPPVQTV